MNKTESIARKIFGWSLNRWDRWYDYEKGVFIKDEDFQPEKNLQHAMLIVERLKEIGYQYDTDGISVASFNHIRAKGETLAQAITNAAYTLIEQNAITGNSKLWRQLC